MPQIITQISDKMHTSWQKELANVVTDPKILLEMLDICPTAYQAHFSARKLFPVRVPRPFISRMEKGNFDDPLLRQVVPLSAEHIVTDGYVSDPLEEHDTVAEGLLHKYTSRVLMIVKGGCAINCRYCFRRHFPYQENSPNKQRWQQALDYIAAHSEINEVIFSGGDPLMASDDHLCWLIEQIEAISHVKRLRIHTRLPVVIPQRITATLVSKLQQSRLKPVFVFHINHENEIDDNFSQALELIRGARIAMFNQATLVKGVNDDAQVLANLSEKLFDNGIQPYYLHMFDAVQNGAHLDPGDQRSIEIMNELMTILPGFLVPKLVREIAGRPNKTLINLR